ncbi:MAG: ferrochelatase [Magnetococcales bacterium]|nr:ferrochelatase [Magnetococcales bacterium]
MQKKSVGVLLLQLGTPDEPTPSAVRRYLAEFLSDPRVVDLSRWLWLPLLHGIILRRRPPRSAALYQKIWRQDGLSPLLYFTQQQQKGVEAALGKEVMVRFAMRYGNPSLNKVLDEMMAAGVTRLLIFPLYPQFSASTTGSALDGVQRYFAQKRAIPTLRFAQPFYDHPLYIKALAKPINKNPTKKDKPFYLFTFHGLPQRHADEGDPYPDQCRITAEKLAKALSLPSDRWRLTFQSRFGRDPWLLPATDAELARLPAQGHTQVVAVCPGFVSDCLETLEEIAQGGEAHFLRSGGERFHCLPCLNDNPSWLSALSQMVAAELSGWEK